MGIGEDVLSQRAALTLDAAGAAIVTMAMMLVVGRLGSVQPKYLITIGAVIAGFALVDLLRKTAEADFWFFAWSRIYLGIDLPLIFLPITSASYDGIPVTEKRSGFRPDQSCAEFGGSMGVLLTQTVLARREQFHQERLAEHVGTCNPFDNDTLHHIQTYFKAQTWTGSSSGTSIAFIDRLVRTQATILVSLILTCLSRSL